MNFSHPKKYLKLLYLVYFVIAFAEVVSEFYLFSPGILILKPLIPLMLIIFYWIASPERNLLFFTAMILSMLTNLLFIPDNQQTLFVGVITFMLHRLVIIFFIVKLLKINDYIPVVIATIPLLLLFFYLLSITNGIPENSFWLLIIQNFLISILGGLAFSNYLQSDNKTNSWLLICGLLFVALQFIVFIERYFLSGISPTVFRPIAMALNAAAFYTLYRFVLAVECSDNDAAP